MEKITCLADAINHVPMVRVIKKGDIRYGEEFEIASLGYKDRIVLIQRTGGFSIYDFAEVQFLTPVKYKGRYIGLGDKVHGYEVMGYYWNGDEWVIRYTNTEDYSNISSFSAGRIKIFEPLHQLTPKIELSTEEMLEELKRRGVCLQETTIEVGAPTSYIPTSVPKTNLKSHIGLSNIIFMNDGSNFSGFNAACNWLSENGYSYGSMQGSAKIGFKKGKCYIGKWRNLSSQNISDLDGYMTSTKGFRYGEAEIVFYKK